ncbi:MAG: chlororespiratory reduction protein 7 [Gloeomargarita sp. GMQP_bins_120]
MANPLLYEGDHYVVLTPTAPEVICTEAELRERLRQALEQMPEVTPELAVYATVEERVQYLLDRACRLEWGEGAFMEWYLVRLEKRR